MRSTSSTEVLLVVVAAGTTIGTGCDISELAQVGFRGKVAAQAPASLGDRTKVEPFALVYEGAQVGPDAYLSQGANIYPGVVTGPRFFAGNGASIRENVRIGDRVSVGSNSVVLPDARLDDDVRIHALALVAEHSRLERGAWLGPGVLLFNTKYPKSNAPDKARSDVEDAPVVGEAAIVGGGAVLNPGVVVGARSLVASGTLVPPGTRIPPASLVLTHQGKLDVRRLADRDDIVRRYPHLVEWFSSKASAIP